MIRINLLPPEITQRRRTEGRVAIMIFVFVIVMAIVGVFAAVMFVQVGAKRDEVASARQELENLRIQAEQFKVFEDKQNDLATRQQMATTALEGRVDWSRLCEEVSLVLPDDVWLNSLSGSEDNVSLSGQALDLQDDVPDSGHKAIARTLVRLTDLDQLYNVWLASSTKAGPQTDFEESWLDFAITASVEEPDTAAEGDTAPPAETP
jgi:Tfp pilus assembly protein PilN